MQTDIVYLFIYLFNLIYLCREDDGKVQDLQKKLELVLTNAKKQEAEVRIKPVMINR